MGMYSYYRWDDLELISTPAEFRNDSRIAQFDMILDDKGELDLSILSDVKLYGYFDVARLNNELNALAEHVRGTIEMECEGELFRLRFESGECLLIEPKIVWDVEPYRIEPMEQDIMTGE